MTVAILRKLAEARTLIRPLAKSESARVVAPGQGRTPPSSIEWTFAPGHVIHEESSEALRAVGLELFVERWWVTERGTIEAFFVLLDTAAEGGSMAWSSELPIDGSKVGATLAGAGALAMVIRHTRLTLLDIPCVPDQEASANRVEVRKMIDGGRAQSRREVSKVVSMGPPVPRGVEPEPDDVPTWADGPTEAEIADVEAEFAVAEDEATVEALRAEVSRAWVAAQLAGAKLDLVGVFKAAFGAPRSPDELDVSDWRVVLAKVREVAAEAREAAGA